MNPFSDLPFWLLDSWSALEANTATSLWLLEVGESYVGGKFSG